MEKIINIAIVSDGKGSENVTIDKMGISWTETIGYLERAKACIVNSDR